MFQIFPMLRFESTIMNVDSADVPGIISPPIRLVLGERSISPIGSGEIQHSVRIIVLTAAGCLLEAQDNLTAVFRYDDMTPKLPSGDVIAAGVLSDRCMDCSPEVRSKCPAYMFVVGKRLVESTLLDPVTT